MSDNLVKDYLEQIEVIKPDQFLDYCMIDYDRWDIYKSSDDTLIYVKYELTGKIGYAFYSRITCKGMDIKKEFLYYVVNYGAEIKENWECDESTKDIFVSKTISILRPHNSL